MLISVFQINWAIQYCSSLSYSRPYCTEFDKRFLFACWNKYFRQQCGNSNGQQTPNSSGLYLYLSSFILYRLHPGIVRAYYTCKKITNSETMQFLCKTAERQGYVLYTMYILESVRKTNYKIEYFGTKCYCESALLESMLFQDLLVNPYDLV